MKKSGLNHYVKLTIACCLFTNIFGCTKNNIYDTLPRGSKISLELLSTSSQIIPIENGLILVYNSSTNWEYINNHLLFFDQQMTFYASCYVPSVKIDSIKNNILYATSDPVKEARADRFVSDLPKDFRLSLTTRAGSCCGSKSDKIVNRIFFSSLKGNEVLIDVMKSPDQYQGLRPATDSLYNKYIIPDTLSLDISTLLIEYDLNQIRKETVDTNGNPIWDILIVKDHDILDEFYKAIMKRSNLK
jgi:hypothetical protein